MANACVYFFMGKKKIIESLKNLKKIKKYRVIRNFVFEKQL